MSIRPPARRATAFAWLVLFAAGGCPQSVPPPPASSPPPAAPAAPAPAPLPTPAGAWEGHLSSDAGPIAGAKVTVTLFSQPRCVTTPCDPHSVGERVLSTDELGVLRLPLGGGGLMGDPDYAMLAIDGFAPQRVELRQTATAIPVRLRKP